MSLSSAKNYALRAANAKFMRRFSSIEQALQTAQATLAADRDTSHPFFWAGFMAVRGPE